jgi:hypothetical protein
VCEGQHTTFGCRTAPIIGRQNRIQCEADHTWPLILVLFRFSAPLSAKMSSAAGLAFLVERDSGPPPKPNLKRAEASDQAWPLGAEITDAVLEQRLFARAGVRPGVRRRVEPDWSSLAREAKRPGVNLMVLWEEYREVHPDGHAYGGPAPQGLWV